MAWSGGRLNADDIVLSVTAASLHITISLMTRDEDTAQAAFEEFMSLSNASTARLSSAFGVPVTAVGATPTRQAVYVASLDAEQGSAPIEGVGSGGVSMTTILIAASAALGSLVAVGLGCKCWCMRSHRKATQLLHVHPTQAGGAPARWTGPATEMAKSGSPRGKYEVSSFI